VPPKLFRLSDAADGGVKFEAVHPPLYSTLSSADAFLLDDTHSACPTMYVWLGKESSLNERRLAVQYAQKYLYSSQDQSGYGDSPVASNIVKMVEGRESEAFLRIVGQ
jgi:gelsolin